MKSILVLVSGTPAQAGRVETALTLARANDSHLTFCLPDPPDIAIGGLDAAAAWTIATFENYAEKTRKFRDGIKAALIEKLQKEDVSWDLREIKGFTHQAFVSQSGLCDLAVVSLEDDSLSFEGQERFLSHVIMQSACPVLALPADGPALDPFGKVLVAWDGSFEASKALKGALPLLEKAEDVLVLSVGAVPEDNISLEEAASYLAHYGVKATTDEVASNGSISERLISTARAIDASYVVMGAYGHSRIMELVLGGVTRSMLTQSQIPILCTH